MLKLRNKKVVLNVLGVVVILMSYMPIILHVSEISTSRKLRTRRIEAFVLK